MQGLPFWFVALVTILQAFSATESIAGYREDAFKKLVDYMRTAAAVSQQEKVTDLHRSFLNTTLDEDKKIVSLSLGVHYLDASPTLALQYLTSAKFVCSEKDPIFPMLNYYLAVARLKTGNPQQAIDLASQILSLDVPNPLKKLALIVNIEASDAMQNYQELHHYFESLTTKFSLGRKLESIAQKGVLALEKTGDMEKANELTEDLARNYPNTPGSRWAFRRLISLSCEKDKSKSKYFYTWKFLKQLSRNITPESGLEDFVIQAVNRPIRLETGETRTLRPEEKAEFLSDAQLYKKALDDLSELYQHESKKPNSQLAPMYLMDLGRNALKLNEPYMASAFFSKYLLDYPTHYMNARVNEFLGDSLRYAGAHSVAAKVYGQALTKKDSRILRWLHFWSTYRSGDLTQAKSLMEKKDYLEAREGDDKLVLEYWRGRILDKMGEKEAAESIFKSILASEGNTFYASMIATKYPHLVNQDGIDGDRKDHEKQLASFAAKMLPANALEVKTGGNTDLLYVKELIRGGLRDLASIHLQNLNWGKISDDETFAAFSRLAYMVGDYNPMKRSQFRAVSAMRSIPGDYQLLIKHQKKYNHEWRLFYPIAYEKIVLPVSKGINISPYLVLAIMRAESFYNKDANSPVGAYGLMQLMPYTAIRIANLLHDEEFDMLELGQPEINISYGAYYLDRLVRYYSGNPYVAVAAYNAGPKAVNQWLASCRQCDPDEFVESIPFRETRRYVREVMRNYVHYTRIYSDKSASLPMIPMPSQLPDEEIF